MRVPAIELDYLADLRVNYLVRLRARVQSLDEFVVGWAQTGDIGSESFANNHRIVHSMISSSAIFGHMELSKEARVTERAFEQHSPSSSENLVVQIRELIRVANEVLANGDSGLQ